MGSGSGGQVTEGGGGCPARVHRLRSGHRRRQLLEPRAECAARARRCGGQQGGGGPLTARRRERAAVGDESCDQTGNRPRASASP